MEIIRGEINETKNRKTIEKSMKQSILIVL